MPRALRRPLTVKYARICCQSKATRPRQVCLDAQQLCRQSPSFLVTYAYRRRKLASFLLLQSITDQCRPNTWCISISCTLHQPSTRDDGLQDMISLGRCQPTDNLKIFALEVEEKMHNGGLAICWLVKSSLSLIASRCVGTRVGDGVSEAGKEARTFGSSDRFPR